MSPRVVAADEFPKLVVGAFGPSECGKTRALEELFLCDAPRRLSIDFAGEMKRKHPAAREVFTIAELREQLADVADQETWHIVLAADPEHFPEMAAELSRILNPSRTSAQHIAYSVEVGGIAVDCSEARNLFPNNKSGWASKTIAWLERGRHNRLVIAVASQSPQSLERRVTDNANHLLAFRTQEDAMLSYWRGTTSATVADLIAELPQYHCAWIEKDAQRVYLLDAERDVYRVLDYKGNTLDNDLDDDEELLTTIDERDDAQESHLDVGQEPASEAERGVGATRRRAAPGNVDTNDSASVESPARVA